VRERFAFYDWADGETPDRVEARWMCSWATAPGEVDNFVAALKNGAELGAVAVAEVDPNRPGG
jgi:threonine aldolase